MTLSFNGRVAIVTGGAGALGRAYCMLLASMGCKVVVNDLGTTVHGGSQHSASPAEQLAREIKAAGGVAIANTEDVSNGEAIVNAAIQAFGRIDIIIHNAGILLDSTLVKMSREKWDEILKVHLTAGYTLAHAAWGHMQKQKYGRFLFTASTSGLYGNFGQANYAAAKMGVWGLAKTLAIEGEKHNIHANVIVPTAASRMTADLMPAEMADALAPNCVAPVGVYLVHEECGDNGVVVETGAGWAGKTRLQRSKGVVLPSLLVARGMGSTTSLSAASVDSVKASWPQISYFGEDRDAVNSDAIKNGQEALALIIERVSAAKQDQNNIVPTASKSVAKNTASNVAPAPAPAASATTAAPAPAGVSGWECDRVLPILAEHLDEEVVKKVKSIFIFINEKDGVRRRWLLDAKNGKGELREVTHLKEGEEGVKADVQLTTTDELFLKLIKKDITPQKLFMSGKLKIRGSIATAMKFEQVLRSMEHKVAGKL